MIASWPDIAQKLILIARNYCSNKLSSDAISEILEAPESHVPNYMDVNDVFIKNEVIITESKYHYIFF